VGEPGSHHAVIDDFYEDQLLYQLVEFLYDPAPPLRAHPLDTPIHLPPNPLPPDLATAERHEIALQGGMMGGRAP
jgi:hypothetical protein